MTTSGLAAVLPLVRTNADLYRWSASNEHGRQMHEAVDTLQAAIPTTDPSEAYAVTHNARASAIKVIARADDSSGIIGDACRRLLDLHPKAAAAAQFPVGRLIDGMMKFQFDGEVDYFDSIRSPTPPRSARRAWRSTREARGGSRRTRPQAADISMMVGARPS